MQRLLVMATAGFICGIIVSDFLPRHMGLLLLLGVGTAGWWIWNRYYSWHKTLVPCLAYWLVLGMVLNQWAILRTEALLAVEPGRRAEFTGIISEEPVRKDDGISFVMQVNRVRQANRDLKIKGKILVNLRQTKSLPVYGDLVRVYGIPELPPEPGNPGQFNYRDYLYNQGIVFVTYLWGSGQVEKLAAGRGNPLIAAAVAVKNRLTAVLHASLPPDQSALLEGVLFGVRSEIDPQIEQEFADTGVVHILSVSGYHIGLVLAGCCLLNRLLKLNRRSFTVFAGAVLVFYTALTGLQPAVIRAAVMAAVLLLGQLLKRDRDWPVTLALSGLVILLANPRILYHSGFQLSFAATWGILYLSPVLQALLLSRLPGSWRPVIAVPLAAQLATLPLSAYYFNQLPLLSLLANLLIVPLIGLVTLLGTLAVSGGLFWPLWAEIVNVSTGLLLALVIRLNSFLAGVPGAVLYLKKPPVAAVVLWYGGLVLLVEGLCYIPLNQFFRRFFMIRRKLILITGSLLLLPAVVLLFYHPPQPLTVTFIDVGEGDSVLVRTPQGRAMLIDTGGSASGFDVGARVLLPVLRNYGITRIDTLVLTHLHQDHIGGAPALLQGLPVREIILPYPSSSFKSENRTAEPAPIGPDTKADPVSKQNATFAPESVTAAITRLAAKKSIPITAVGAGDRINLDQNIAIEILAPAKNNKSTAAADSNNSSIVLKLAYGPDTMLLTGDIEQPAMDRLLDSNRDLQADVLKVPHHGSRNGLSGEFYHRVSPKLAVISVGRNLFGHPAGEVLTALRANDIRIARTDRHGAVTLTSEGHGWRGQTVKKGEI